MSTPRKVAVDDTDGRIRYSGQGWFQDEGSKGMVGDFGPTYKHTQHGTNANGGLDFSFEGTSITLYGTTQLSKIGNDGRWEPTWECFIDQVSIGSTTLFEFAENNWLLCEKGGLDDGHHTFSVQVTTSGQPFWVDRLLFTPSPHAAFDEAVLYLEDSDLGIVLSSGWGPFGGNAIMTSVKGSQAKIDFVGKSVTWVGFVPTELPHSPATGSYSIDGGQSTPFKLNGLPAQSNNLYNQMFFTTPELEPGPHSLVVTYVGADGPATPLTLHYMYLTNTSIRQSSGGTVASVLSMASIPSSQNTASGASSKIVSLPSASNGTSMISDHSFTTITTPGATPIITTINGSLIMTVTPRIPPTDSSIPEKIRSSPTPVGTIVGGVVGGFFAGLALVALVVFLILWRRRHQRREVHPHERRVNPFMSNGSQLRDASGADINLTSLRSTSRYNETSTSNNQDHFPNIDNVNGVREMRKSRFPMQSNVNRPLTHQDSGVRFAAQEDVIAGDVPPVYTIA